MSTNIHIYGIRQVMVIKTGKVIEQETQFSCWQTPTVVTEKIIEHPHDKDRIQKYKSWILSKQKVERLPRFKEDDIFGEGEPIGYEEFNAAQEHVDLLDSWLEWCKEEGYEVVIRAW
jgi:hypothetical protein